ncbi:MAG TPA: hypothetical protein VFI91_13920 [Longimicrobiaceae bacterium]|nr:hypothetical protein [Longimicrobiaceae bacterium]
MHKIRNGRGLACLLAVLVIAACDSADPPEPPVVETSDSGALDGLTRDQIREQARPMTPERAEALGIVDTTIHLEDPTIDLDTMLPIRVNPVDTSQGR